MSYSRENVMKAKELFALKRTDAEARAIERKRELAEKFPEIGLIDGELALTGEKIFSAIREGRDGIEERIAALREENMSLRHRRSLLLLAHGYPADYSDLKYDCSLCADTGYVGIKMCSCMRRSLIEAGMASSGLSTLLHTQSFENFSTDYYRDDPEKYSRMCGNYQKARKFAEEFSLEDGEKKTRSMLFMGGTGLGKTHLSTAIARVLIGRGFDVYYNSAVGMISDFEHRRFGTGLVQNEGDDTSRYTECDLLILDDLGTEMINQFTVSCLYHVINTRLNMGKPTLINTNLPFAELRKLYGDRIASRLMGEYTVLSFCGTDVRKQKLMNQ